LRRLLRGRHHFWQGKPGLWMRLLVADVARAIARNHAGVFERFNYVCDPDVQLTPSQADAHWIDLNRAELTEKLWHYTATRHELEQTREQLDLVSAAAGQLQKLCIAAHLALAAARECPEEKLEGMRKELARIQELLAKGHEKLAQDRTNKWVRIRSLLARTLRRVWT
jgi:hypothetical protein